MCSSRNLLFPGCFYASADVVYMTRVGRRTDRILGADFGGAFGANLLVTDRGLGFSPGTKLTVVQHNPWVAFEVDEIESRFDWRSVVIHGTIYFLDPSGGDRDREAYATALELMRAVDADVMTAVDPAPHRTTLFRIHADRIIGRAARTAG